MDAISLCDNIEEYIHLGLDTTNFRDIRQL